MADAKEKRRSRCFSLLGRCKADAVREFMGGGGGKIESWKKRRESEAREKESGVVGAMAGISAGAGVLYAWGSVMF